MPNMSHSRTETAECLARYFHNYVAGTEKAPNASFMVGTPVHKALESDAIAALRGEGRLSRAEMLGIAYNALTETIAKDDRHGLITWDGFKSILDRVEAIIAAYVSDLQPRYTPTAAPEFGFDVPIPGSRRWNLIGFLDGQAHWDGVPSILDFKTANKPWRPGQEAYKPQATAYLWAMRHEMRATPEATPKQVVFCVFPTQRVGNGWRATLDARPTTRTDQQVNAYPAYLNSVIRRIDEAERTGSYPASPGPLCSYCAFWHACPEGRAHTGEAGKPEYTLPIVERAS